MFQRFLEQHSFSEYDFRQDFLPSVEDRAFWESFGDESFIKLAGEALDYAWPVVRATDHMEFKKSGNRKIMEVPHFDRRNHLVLFALAELKENKGRFLPQLVNGLFAICEETSWTVSAHRPNKNEFLNIPRVDEPFVELFAAETAEHLAVIYSVLYQPLNDYCPEILDRIEYELNRRIKAPYMMARRDWRYLGYMHTPNNWNPWVLSNILTVYLLTENNERKLHRALTKMFEEIQFYYQGVPEDGGCDEGPNYWSRAGASLFEFVYQIKQATGGALNFFTDEKMALIASYLKKAHLFADRFVNVADAHARGFGGYAPLIFCFARETEQKDLMAFSAALYRDRTTEVDPLSHTTRTLRRLIYVSEALKEMEKIEVKEPLHGTLELLPKTELAVLRRGDWILGAKGGNNDEAHNHNDVGSYMLYHKTTPVLIDVGINTYTRFTFTPATRYTMIPWTRSVNHNLPIVRGVEQKFGGEFRADCFDATETGIKISFADAYPKEAGLSSLVRSLTLEEDAAVMTDVFAFAEEKPVAVTEVLMSVLPVRMEGNDAILGERYRVSANGTVRTEWLAFEDPELENDWKTKGVTKILIENESPDRVTVRVTEYRTAN